MCYSLNKILDDNYEVLLENQLVLPFHHDCMYLISIVSSQNQAETTGKQPQLSTSNKHKTQQALSLTVPRQGSLTFPTDMVNVS